MLPRARRSAECARTTHRGLARNSSGPRTSGAHYVSWPCRAFPFGVLVEGLKIAPQDNRLCCIMPSEGHGFPCSQEAAMSEEVYGPERAQRLVALLRAL